MPRLTENVSQRPCIISGRFTETEQNVIQEIAESRGLSPSGFVRNAALSATEATPTERLILEKLCETQSLLKLLFGGLFAQLNEKDNAFTGKKFADALKIAADVRHRQADELLRRHAGTGENNAQSLT